MQIIKWDRFSKCKFLKLPRSFYTTYCTNIIKLATPFLIKINLQKQSKKIYQAFEVVLVKDLKKLATKAWTYSIFKILFVVFNFIVSVNSTKIKSNSLLEVLNIWHFEFGFRSTVHKQINAEQYKMYFVYGQ